MNIIKAGGKYRIYGEEIESFDRLPSKTFMITFNKQEGFSLSTRNNLEITEEKIYGDDVSKAQKVMKSYNVLNRNLGVLLSGPKGIGKSLFLRILAKEAIQRNLPVIVVDASYPGIANFISSIDQDCVVIFDEFEKTFTITEDDGNAQDELLSLFDGIDGGHKLFVVTCNELNKVSKYMINRPGRFHYHFTMTPPTADEVKDYMTDKLLPEYHDQIKSIVNLSNIVDMPYDYLRAFAFELNQGYSLKEALNDLNITKEDYSIFDIELHLSNGIVYEGFNVPIDFTTKDYTCARVRRFSSKEKDKSPRAFYINYKTENAKIVNGEFVIDNKDIFDIDWHDVEFSDDLEEDTKLVEQWKKLNVQPVKIILRKVKNYGSERYEI